MNIPQQGLSCVTVSNQMAPPEGPNTIPIPLDFAAETQYTLDYSNQQPNRFSILQSIFVDNSANGSGLTIECQGTQQQIKCPHNSQGWFMVLCPNPIRLIFTSTGGVTVKVYLCNFPVAPAVWSV